MIGSAIGMKDEWSAAKKKRNDSAVNEQPSEHRLPNRDQHDETECSGDEEGDWELEEAQDLDEIQGGLNGSLEPGTEGTANLSHPPPTYTQHDTKTSLSMPVVLPQRRPESRNRGFVRAYSPVLAEAGINQASWFKFLDGFDKAISQNPWFHVANAAVFVAGKVRLALEGISLIAHFVTLAIHLGVESGRRVYMQSTSNTYLDKMNAEFFQPRGLFCLLIKYKPKSNEVTENVDIQHNTTETIAKRDGHERGTWKKMITSSDSTTKHEEEIPEFAPLTFPQLDRASDQQKQSATKQFGRFVTDYYDRQARARFDGQYPDSKLTAALPPEEWASKYSDPNSAVNQGGSISLASGGRYNPTSQLSRINDRRNQRRERLGVGSSANKGPLRSAMQGDQEDAPQHREVGRQGRKNRRSRRPLKRVLKADALYLMVVNMPTQEEMDTILQVLEKVKDE
ncbi:hypothetical protein MBLNU459_g7769t1 [Dothideomycetes sp. NU459]